ncbi:HalOD1 output domain-containing protein [Haloarcula amylolytica]|uniref:HalOD1 output domain-containing protein n=1 Tax=Haloarcula amylolytica TaxID=396317 RepID=UPI003C7170F0
MTGNNSSHKLSRAVLRAISDATGVPIPELNETLYAAVDPDALDRLFRDTDGFVTFEFAGYLITVDSSGTVEVEELS